jgi:hypothetical protein
MNIEITCPMCKFSKTVQEDKIPDGVRWVVCPGCRHRFEFTPLKPGAAGSEESSPWERRLEIGLWKGISQTFVSVLFAPGRFFMEKTPGKGIREPLAFGLLLGSLGYMMGFFWDFLLVSSGLMPYSSYLFDEIPLNTLFLILMILSPLLVIINIFFTSAVIHLLALVFNGGKGGFKGTFRVIAFGQATRGLAFIPVIGGFIGWCWNIVTVVIGLREVHRTSNLRAIAAVVTSIILKCLMLLPLYLLKTLVDFSGILQ